jgi:hypothetical protein
LIPRRLSRWVARLCLLAFLFANGPACALASALCPSPRPAAEPSAVLVAPEPEQESCCQGCRSEDRPAPDPQRVPGAAPGRPAAPPSPYCPNRCSLCSMAKSPGLLTAPTLISPAECRTERLPERSPLVPPAPLDEPFQPPRA